MSTPSTQQHNVGPRPVVQVPKTNVKATEPSAQVAFTASTSTVASTTTTFFTQIHGDKSAVIEKVNARPYTDLISCNGCFEHSDQYLENIDTRSISSVEAVLGTGDEQYLKEA